MTAYSDRIAPRIVAAVVDPHLPGNATISDTGMTGQITDHRNSEATSVQLDSSGIARLPPCAIIRTGTFDGELGVDLVQWGDIDDDTADNSTDGATQWALTGQVTAEVEDGNQFLRLFPTQVRGASARSIARPTTPLHRWYDSSFEPVDGDPTYSVQMRTRGKGVVDATLRIAVYDVNDTDPTTEPVSTLLHETPVQFSVPDSSTWRDFDVDVTATVNAAVGRLRPNAVLVYVIVPRGSPELDIDDVRLMEWRKPLAGADGLWVPADAVRGAPLAKVSVEQSGCDTPTG